MTIISIADFAHSTPTGIAAMTLLVLALTTGHTPR